MDDALSMQCNEALTEAGALNPPLQSTTRRFDSGRGSEHIPPMPEKACNTAG
eukprot:m.1547453 g.1547453  ORF g.1547453 m.1547453 type:complete len:52 (+) comp25260_c0_seq117:3135-3290(+)